MIPKFWSNLFFSEVPDQPTIDNGETQANTVDFTDYTSKRNTGTEAIRLTDLEDRFAFLKTVDIVFLCALRKESQAVHEVFGDGFDSIRVDSFVYYTKVVELSDVNFRICTLSPHRAGPSTAAIFASVALMHCEPSLIVMTGICGGISDEVKLGDIIIADQVYDFLSSKLTDDGQRPSFEPHRLNDSISSIVNHELQDWKLDTSTLWFGKLFAAKCELVADAKVALGHFGTSSSVVASDSVKEEIALHDRKTLAIDMEAYSVANATKLLRESRTDFMILKSVSDNANSNKKDALHAFCSHVSAQVALDILKHLIMV